MSEIYIYLGSYIALLLVISYFVSKRQNSEDFLISGRDRGGWQIMASKFAGAIGAGYFITYTGFAYEYGLGVFAMLVGIIVGYFLFAYWAAPKVHAPSREHKFYTMGDFVYHKTNSKFSLKLTNLLSSIIVFGWLLVGIVGGAKIISDFGLMSYSTAVIVTILVVLSYIILAGFKAVIITDVIQSIIIILLLFLVTFGVIGNTSISEILSANTGGVDIGIAVSFFLFGLLAIFSYSNMYQLCYAGKNVRKVKHGLGLAVIPVVLVAFFLLLIGMFMATNVSGLDSGLVFTEALKNFLPASILPFAIVLFFAGIMSSADTSIYAIASHYVLSKKRTNLPVSSIRMTMIALMAFTLVISLIFTDIVDISILAGGLSLTLSFAMIYLFFGGKNSKRFAGSAIGGVIGLIVGVVVLGIEPTAAIFVIVGGTLGLLWKY